MYCQNCGTQNTGDKCTNCGMELESQGVKNSKKKTILKKWWFWLIIIVVLFVIIIASSGEENKEGSIVKGEIKTDAANTVENVAEYEINRVFVTTKLEALLDGFTYYEADAGNEFIVIDANVKNLTSQWADAETLVKVTIEIDGTIYNSTNYVVSEDDIDSYSGLDALETSRMYFAVQVPQGTNTEDITLTMTCGGKTSSCQVSVSEYEAKKEYIVFNKEYTDNSTMNIKFEKVFYTNRLDPSRKDGAYSYYEAENGKKYLVTKLKVKNLKGSSLSDDDVTGIKCIYNGKYNYDGFICTEEDDGSDLDSYSSIDPLDTRTMYYLIEVPVEVEKGPTELEIYLMGETYYYKVK